MRLAGFTFWGERRIRKGDGGDEQSLATARDHEGRGRALVSALRRERYARRPAPARAAGILSPLRARAKRAPAPPLRGMGRCQPSKEGHRHGKDVQHRYRGKSHFGAREGEEGGQRERRDPLREREFGTLLPQDAGRGVPQARTNGDRHHNLQAPSGALVRTGGQAQGFVR
jgi:hypothetical protein